MSNAFFRWSLGLTGLAIVAIAAPARAADLVCRGVMFGDTDFAAYQGEAGFGRLDLTFRRNNRTVSIPLSFVGVTEAGFSHFRGNNPDQPSDVAEVFAPRGVGPGGTIRAVYNGNSFPGNCTSTLPDRPPSGGNVPREGFFEGRGTARNPVFQGGATTTASLSFNASQNFSVSVAVPPGTGAQVSYQGRIDRIRSTGANENSFAIEGRVTAFASSADGLRVQDTSGRCNIEVFDARIVEIDCRANVPNGNTSFLGTSQF